MARARNIKPGFFKNEELAECTPWGRLCFIGLWTLADRAGRLEDRPKRIKGELFAYDSVEVEPLLADLAARGFILRYKDAAGQGLIQIIKFQKHQSPHHREHRSVLASPQSLGLLLDEFDHEAQDEPEADLGPNDDGCPDQGCETALNPDTGFLIPDSGYPIPEPPCADAAAKTPRATRKAPKSFLVSGDLQRWAREEGFTVDIRAETAKFRDHTFKSSISDWPGAWRNWIRKAEEISQGRPGAKSPMKTEDRNAEAKRLLGFTDQETADATE